jgi:SSS family solute:Na+ symporter
MDFVRPWYPDMSQQNLVRIGQVSTIGALIVAIIWAPTIAQFQTLYGFLQSILSYTVPPVVAVFFLGILWKRITATAAFLTLAILIPLGIVMFILSQLLGIFSIHFLYFAGLLFATSVIFLIVVSLLGEAPPREKTDELTWESRYWTEETRELQGTPLWKNYRFLSIVMLVSTAVIVYIFR